MLAPLLLAAAIILFQYFGSETYIKPETGQKSRLSLSTEEEAQLGLQSFQEVLSQVETVESGAEHAMVLRVTKKLIAAVDDQSKKFEWNARLVKSDQINAFCLPGGKIVVYTGILPVAQNEAGLAAVLGHEIAHATARHGAQRLFQQQLVQTGMIGVQGAFREMEPGQRTALLAALGAGVQYGLVLPYGRNHELEADKIGLYYMARAGYDPREAVDFWKRMSNVNERQPIEWASTHPSNESRIREIEALIPEALRQHPTRGSVD